MSKQKPKIDLEQPTVDTLIWAYRRAAFPMVDPITDCLEWFSPDPRAVFPLDAFHVPRNVARLVRQARFEVRSDTAFVEVMQACAGPRRDDDLSWIDDRLVGLYAGLFERGMAHTIEAWRDGRLVGGLYGVHLGGAFFGESMFIRPEQGGSGASKVCLVHLVRWLRHRGFTLLDTQFRNPHLEQFGVCEIPLSVYRERLANAVDRPVTWGTFALRPDDPM